MIQKATLKDIQAMVSIHINALPDDMLSRLGPAFLEDHFYPIVLQSRHATTLVSKEHGIVNAFCIVASNGRLLTAQLKKNKLSLIKYSMKLLFRKIGYIIDVLSHVQNFSLHISDPVTEETVRTAAEIYVIATHPSHQGKGIGGSLIAGAMNIIDNQFLMVKTSSERAKNFYVGNGFREVGYEIRGREKYSIFLKKNSYYSSE